MNTEIKKWEFVPEDTIEIFECKLTRIRALVDYPNGFTSAGELGGYIEKAENLSGWGWVRNNGKVFGNGHVSDNGLVYENAQVYDNGKVYEDGRVFGNGRVFRKAQVFGNGTVFGNGQVYDNAQVYDNGRVHGDGAVFGNGQVYNTGRVHGNTYIYGDSRILGVSEIYGRELITGDAFIQSKQDIISFSHVGSENGTLTAYRTKDGSVMLTRGCFRGTVDWFLAANAITHEDSPKIKMQYEMLIAVIRHHFDI